MSTAKKVWKGEATYLTTNGYGGGDADLAADGAYDKGADIDLETNGYEAIAIYLEHDSAGTTDNIVLGIFSSLDGTDFADNPDFEIEYDATGGADTQEPAVIVFGPAHLKIGVRTTGTTDTFDYRIRWDAWRWDIS